MLFIFAFIHFALISVSPAAATGRGQADPRSFLLLCDYYCYSDFDFYLYK